MNGNQRFTRIRSALLLALILSLLVVGVALAAGNIDTTSKWAWGGNIGWINFTPDTGGVTVFSDHLEGYAWGENIGWIRLGAYTGGGSHTYANDAAGTYGVNHNGAGTLSGYAWGTNIGWINFAPANGGVTINLATGDFNGYAWGENVGWIHFQNGSPAYKVTTSWRDNLLVLAVNQGGTGSGVVALNPAGGTYTLGAVVSATATANPGSTFTGWSGACGGNGACNVTMTAAKAVTATFMLDRYALATVVAGSGTVSLNPAGGTYDEGTVVTVTATASPGATFLGWSGACSGSGACSVTMAAAQAVTATFTLNTYLLTTATAGAGTGTVSLNPAGGTYGHGTVVTATATANPGSTFVGWDGACTGAGPCTVTMDTAKAVIATFDVVTGAGASIYLPLIKH